MRSNGGPELWASNNRGIFPNNLLCHLPGLIKIGCRHSPHVPCPPRPSFSLQLRGSQGDLTGWNACKDDFVGPIQDVLAFIEEPKGVNRSIGITISVFKDQILAVEEFLLIFLQLMGRMAILKKVDDFPVGGMGIIIDMAGASC